VYEIDEETMLILNITTYFFNVTKANLGNPEWEYYHNILSDYGMPDASPASFEQFALNTKNDEALAAKKKNWSAKGGPDSNSVSCDESCRLGQYCSLINSYAEDKHAC